MLQKSKMKNIFFLICCVIFQTMAFLCIKTAAVNIGDKFLDTYLAIYVMSILFLGFQALFWQLLLKKIDLSRAYSFMVLVYPLVLFFGHIFFDEQIKVNNIVGVVIIMVGIIIINSPFSNKKEGE